MTVLKKTPGNALFLAGKSGDQRMQIKGFLVSYADYDIDGSILPNLNTLVRSIRHNFRKSGSVFFVSIAKGHFEPRRQDFRPFQICTQLADCFWNNLLNHNTCKKAFDSKTSGQRCQRKSLKKMDNVWECTLIKNNYSALSQQISVEFSNTVVPTSC